MISASRVAFETIIVTVPDFRPRYQEFLADWQGEDTPWYLAMGELAHHIVDTYEQGGTTRYPELFSAIENVPGDGDTEVQNLIWVGLLDDIQNTASHRSFGADVFRVWLGPKSLKAWNELNRGWQRLAEWASQQRRSSDHSRLDVENALSRVENPELRRILQQMYRKNN